MFIGQTVVDQRGHSSTESCISSRVKHYNRCIYRFPRCTCHPDISDIFALVIHASLPPRRIVFSIGTDLGYCTPENIRGISLAVADATRQLDARGRKTAPSYPVERRLDFPECPPGRLACSYDVR